MFTIVLLAFLFESPILPVLGLVFVICRQKEMVEFLPVSYQIFCEAIFPDRLPKIEPSNVLPPGVASNVALSLLHICTIKHCNPARDPYRPPPRTVSISHDSA